MSKKEIKPIECADCGHVLVEHYHLKSSGHGCIRNNGPSSLTVDTSQSDFVKKLI